MGQGAELVADAGVKALSLLGEELARPAAQAMVLESRQALRTSHVIKPA